MRIDIATLFVDMCETVLNESIIGRARRNEAFEVRCHHIRDYTEDKHRRVDDSPYGGGMGMLMQADPIYRCFEQVCGGAQPRPHVIYMSPQGRILTQKRALELSRMDHLFIICGHYEGVDERLIDEIVDEEISIGDYVMTGGELGALILTDCILRLCDGVLASAECYQEESHFNGLLEYPHYTRPPVWRGREIPEVLVSGHHANITAWRRRQSIERTCRKRPDLLEKADLTEEEHRYAEEYLSQIQNAENQL